MDFVIGIKTERELALLGIESWMDQTIIIGSHSDLRTNWWPRLSQPAKLIECIGVLGTAFGRKQMFGLTHH